MGFWNKFGQIALQAAPYVAAPFTGGMSLSAAPLTGKLANKLEDKSDKKEFEKTGIAPTRSMMNKIMGGVNAAAGLYGGAKIAGKIGGGDDSVMSDSGGITGMLGKGKGGGLGDFAKQFANQQLTGGTAGGFGGILSNLGGGSPTTSAVASTLPNTGGKEIPGVAGWRGESFGDFNYRNPDLGAALNRGKMRARGLSPSFA